MVSSGLVPVAVFVALLHAIQTAQPVSGLCESPNCYIDENGGEVACRLCPVGHGVHVEDRQLMSCQSAPYPRDTQCDPCTAGVNYSDVVDSESTCKGCNSCHPVKEEIQQNCTAHQKLLCRCIPGVYYDSTDAGVCWPCRVCKADEVEVRECLGQQDRLCEKRPTPSPASTTPNASTPNAASSFATVEDPPAKPTGLPKIDVSNANSGNTWIIVGSVLGVLFVLAIIVACMLIRNTQCWKAVCRAFGCNGGENNHPGGSSPTVCNLFTCIYHQENVGITPQVSYIASENGDVAGQPILPNGLGARTLSGVNGSADGRRSEASLHRAGSQDYTPVPTAPPLEPEVTWRFPSDLIEKLDGTGAALEVARVHLQLSESVRELWRQGGSPATYLSERWETDERTRDELITALRNIERDDIADDVLRTAND